MWFASCLAFFSLRESLLRIEQLLLIGLQLLGDSESSLSRRLGFKDAALICTDFAIATVATGNCSGICTID